ncbi:retention module-containing protein, partial [Achromobacter xylosoxidans]|uniref:retention module-containing protein n=1 Tax=Alcaligenes xylosoxydans xylosoxydans TaxID=85698 RepID=UPI0009D77524
MANSSPAVVNEITGRAWIRNSDGSLTELHQGSKVPAGSDIVTASGATVALQVENGMPIVIGEGRAVAVTEDMAGPLADPTEAAVAAPKGTDSDRLLAALQAGQDPFDVLDPTAATLTGGSGDDGGGSFVRLARILETTSPLDLAYPNPGRGADTIDRASSGAGGDGGGAGDNNNAPLAINDVARTDEKSAVRGNLLINDSDPDGDPLSLVSINGRPMTPNGVAVTGSNGGTFIVQPDGSYVFVPGTSFQHLPEGQTTTTTISYVVTDPSGATSTATVEVTVVGVNDPAQITASKPGDDAGTVVEDDAEKTTANGKLNVVDPDDGQSFFMAVANRPGVYGTFSIDANGNWVYNLNQVDPRVQALAVGEKLTETFTVTTADGTTGTVTITINGTNDEPELSGKADGAVAEDGTTIATGKLDVTDVDTSDTHTWTVSNNGDGQYGKFTVDANGNWKYELDNTSDKVQALKEGEKVTDTITVTVDDGHGGTATKTITVDITGTNDAAVITPSKPGDDKGTVQEDTTLTASGKLDVADPDAGEAVFRPQTDFQGKYGTFSIDANGNWSFKLDNDAKAIQQLGAKEHLAETFTVTSADGVTSQVVITINGTNDAPTVSGTATGAVAEDGTTTTSGQLTKTDVDVNDKHTWSVNNDGKGQYGTFTVDQNGKWTYVLDNDSAKVQALTEGQKVTDTITVTVDDGNGGTATQVITVDITGTNDAAVITPSKPGDDKGTVQEDTTLTANGKLDIVDKDAGQASFKPQTDFQGQYGKFSIDANGNWSFKLDNDAKAIQQLGAKEHLTEAFTVTSADGTTSQVIITINGTNDAPTVSGTATGAVAEDGTTTTSGQLTKTDVDVNDKHTWSVNNEGKGQYGTFTVDQNGKWTYVLDNDSAKVQALTEGQKVTDTITVTVDDG